MQHEPPDRPHHDLNGFIFPFDTQVIGWDREARYLDEYWDYFERDGWQHLPRVYL